MGTKKEITAMDFITITQAGNIVVTDPVTGDEYLCFRQEDNTFIHSVNKEVLTIKDICIATLQRMALAREIDQKIAEKKKTEAENAAKGVKTDKQQTSKKQAPKQQSKNFCIHCGAPLSPGDKFCMNCGEKL